jgi:hypothetical protein
VASAIAAVREAVMTSMERVKGIEPSS